MVCKFQAVLSSTLLFFLILQQIVSAAYHETIDDKILALKSLPRDNGLIILNMEIVERYLLSSPRNYSFVLLVGTKVAQCEPCKPAIAALSNIANKWDRQHPESSEIFFGFVDFAHHLELIRFLQVHTAPFLFHIAPRQHLKDWIKTNHHEILSSPSLLAEWISKVSGSHVEATLSMDFSFLLPLTAIALFCVILAKVKWLRNAKLIGILCLIFICGMCSGFMWVSIHSMPFMSVREGKVMYFYPEQRAQIGCECLIIMLFYAMTSGGVVFLTNLCPKFRRKGLLYCVGVLIGVGIATLGFNQMAQYFTLKGGFLPYHFSLI